MSRLRLALVCLAILAVVGFGVHRATRPTASPTEVSAEAPPELVSAYTAGRISRKSAIRVRFVSEMVEERAVGAALAESPFTFEPVIPGVARWGNRSELEFQPAADLDPGSRYTGVVHLDTLLPGRPEAKAFAIEFIVLRQDYTPALVGLESSGEEGAIQSFRGSVQLADVADDAAVEKILTPAHDADVLSVVWTHDNESFAHQFTVQGIRRVEQASTLTLSFDGAPVGVQRAVLESVPVPGLNQFVVSSIRAQMEGERVIEIRFSDPVDPRQDLRGLIRVERRNDVRLQRDGSIVRVTASGAWNGTEVVVIADVKSARGYTLMEARTETVSFEPIKPQVRFVGQSVILPTSADLTVAVEVVNVRAIEVEATRVYETNVPQFLQVNDLTGDSDLRRVGTVVWKDRVEIAPESDHNNRWVRVGLDLSELVKAHPTGLYRLKVTFQRADIAWDCPKPAWEERPDAEEGAWDGQNSESSFWDMWSDESEDWSWSGRNDPCEKGYYNDWGHSGRTASRNVVITDVGLLARQGAGGAVTVVATNLRTAEPIPGAAVQLLDFQLQELAGGTTDSSGSVRLDGRQDHPFAVVARSGGQVSWLRLDRGEALSVAHFDVGGAEVKQGLKGFLYGERGVWRPGDAIFLTFVLHDETGALPASHPIEFQLRDPRNQVVDSRTLTHAVDGFYAIRAVTAEDAPTGNYTAVVRAGGAAFSRTLKVEMVIPNRLKIDLPVPSGGVRQPSLSFTSVLTSRWLHGAIARNLDADIEVKLSPRTTTFAKFADFVFDDPTAAFESEASELWKGQLDGDGKATVDANIDVPSSPGMLTATLRTRVFEPSGAASVDEIAVPVSPYDRYVGIALPKGDKARGMLLTDTKHKVRVVALDADGKPKGGGTVSLSVRKLRWRWWWEKGDEDLAEYAGTESRTELATGLITLKNGEGSWEYEVKYPEWGRYLVTARDDDGGHVTGKIIYMDWPGWAGRAQKDNPGGASVLSLTTDQDKVEVGQPITLSFPMPRGARALVSLENGSGIVATEWVLPSPTGDTAQFVITATPEMAPNVYAHVTVIQPHQSAENDAPIRLYGILPFSVYDPGTKLQPEIATAATFTPSSTALVSVRESAGRAMTYTLAVVDEGLLGLTRYGTPNPWDTMYAREALGVRTWDLFDFVAGAYGGTIEQLLSIGGDGEGETNKRPKAQRFKPVVWYGGPYTLAAGKTDKREVPIPQYVGEVRVMVVAGRDGAFGSAEQAVPVRTPLMALATLPRVLGPEEEVELPVSLFAMDAKIKDVTVTVATSGPIEVLREKTRSVKFTEPGESMTAFRLKVGSALGVAKVTVTTTGAGEKSVQTLEIDVRHPGAPVTEVVASSVAAGKTWSTDVAFPGLAGTNEVTVEVSRMPPLNLRSRLDDLIVYPHGCVEQTTSAAFPQLALRKLVDLTPGEAAAADANVKEALVRLRSFQGADGSFGYWPGEGAHDWSSTYVGHFLLEAERAGFPLPTGMRAAWLRHQKERANRWVKAGEHADLEQAYRLYTLALAGSADIGAMNRLKETQLSMSGRWRLAAAYVLAGQKATAKDVLAGATIEGKAYRELGGTFGSGLRDQAQVLDTLILVGDLSRAVTVAAEVSKALAAEGYLSTQEVAQALLAMSRFGDASGGPGETAFSWSWAGGKSATVTSDRPMAQVRLPVGSTMGGKLTIESRSSGTLFARVIARGLPPVGRDAAGAEGLAVDVDYVSVGGQSLSVRALDHGTDLIARVTVRNTSGRKLEELALTQIFPSGWEINGLSPGKSEGCDYRDVRDDRVYTYFDLAPGGEVTFSVPANASYQGHFYLPPISVEAMYDASIQARQPGMWVDVATTTEG